MKRIFMVTKKMMGKFFNYKFYVIFHSIRKNFEISFKMTKDNKKTHTPTNGKRNSVNLKAICFSNGAHL